MLLTDDRASSGGFARSDFSNSVLFPIGSDVFNLPAGVTANAPDPFIVNNLYIPTSVTPLPATLPLFGTGLGGLGLLGWRRKRKASAALAAA